MKQIQDHGFIADVPQPEDYVFGQAQIPEETLVPDGQWDAFLPEKELQNRNGLETMNCTVYGTLNCLEILLKFHMKDIGGEFNFSERYTGILAETTRTGNSPHKVIEVIRKTAGLISDDLLPFGDDIEKWDQYYSPNPMARGLLNMGQLWLEQFLVKHQWVFTGGNIEKKQKLLKEALKISPIGVSVMAWAEKNGRYYKPVGYQDNHWVTLYGYVEGDYWKVFDHYDNVHKKLEWNYDFGFAKRYHTEKLPIMQRIKPNRIVDWLKRLWGLITGKRLILQTP